MGLIFLYLSVALGISFLCSILEAVLLSTPMSYISMKEAGGSISAKKLIKFKTNIDRPIAAILSLNTIAHTIGAAGVGAEAVKVFGESYFGVISAVLTILILVFSEIIPKTIGARYCKSLALYSSSVIEIMIWISYPLVWMSEFITKIISPKQQELTVTREEICAMVKVGEKEGVFESTENRVIQNLIKLESVKVSDIMTPRIVTVVANEDESLKEFYSDKSFRPYSRIPLYREEVDIITGYVLSKDVLEYLSDGKYDVKLKEVKRSIMHVVANDSVSVAWEKMLESKDHIALVVNEYGSFEGIVSMEDIVETILGLEIIDEKDTIVDMQQFAREKWQERLNKYKQLSN